MTNGEPETVVSASLQERKSIKNPFLFFKFFYFIKSETSDSFVNHFDGHFAYLKTLDCYFKCVILASLTKIFSIYLCDVTDRLFPIYLCDINDRALPAYLCDVIDRALLIYLLM